MDIKKFLTTNVSEIKSDLLKLIHAESPSKNVKMLDECREIIKEMMTEKFDELFKLTEFNEDEFGTHLLYEPETTGKPRILMLSHYDTVWNVGELEIVEEENKLFGPGVFDMKAGLLSSIWSVRSVLETKDLAFEPVLLFTADEEVGSATSRPLIEKIAKTCDAVFVLEPPQANTHALKTERKGVGRFTITAKGVSAHAGNHHEDGANAIDEIAKVIVKVSSLTDYDVGTTVNVGQITGGSKTNVVPEFAKIEVDFRVKTQKEADRVERYFNALVPEDNRIKLDVTGGLNRPPLENTPANEALFAIAEKAAENLGIRIDKSKVGGGSDGNFTSAIGIPTIDGLGIPGDGAHARNEHILFDYFVERCALVAETCHLFATKNKGK